MKIKRRLEERAGDFELLLEEIVADPTLHDYGLPRTAWIRAVKLIKRHGVEAAVEMIDKRAELAAEGGKIAIARRWRDLIAAIHAMTEEERLPGDKTH